MDRIKALTDQYVSEGLSLEDAVSPAYTEARITIVEPPTTVQPKSTPLFLVDAGGSQ